ncbi:hypothetical protein [Nonomuraea sp. CA-141351]|uniref:hypothetical protein n=1 Tax=Nonomuraea sp. CA-141351 TaxID=3239996 RepID=UPI003D8CC952
MATHPLFQHPARGRHRRPPRRCRARPPPARNPPACPRVSGGHCAGRGPGRAVLLLRFARAVPGDAGGGHRDRRLPGDGRTARPGGRGDADAPRPGRDAAGRATTRGQRLRAGCPGRRVTGCGGVHPGGTGTSLPKLVTSIQAQRRGNSDLLVDNLLGSNLVNSLAGDAVIAFTMMSISRSRTLG